MATSILVLCEQSKPVVHQAQAKATLMECYGDRRRLFMSETFVLKRAGGRDVPLCLADGSPSATS
jgi:hypothetical protein